MVVVEDKPGALLVGVVVGLCARAGVVGRARYGTGGLSCTGSDMGVSPPASNHMSGT